MKISMFCVKLCLDSKHNVIWDALKKYTGQEKLMESFDNKKIEFYITKIDTSQLKLCYYVMLK